MKYMIDKKQEVDVEEGKKAPLVENGRSPRRSAANHAANLPPMPWPMRANARRSAEFLIDDLMMVD